MLLTSIIIPTFNHGQIVDNAIDSALAQSAPVEVIVVDDGSTDGTSDMLRAQLMRRDDSRIKLRTIAHSGPAIARNVGIESAHGEFLMFLDADDTIEPDKVERQLLEMTPTVGFVLCDVTIIETNGNIRHASERYRYDQMELSGWIADLLIGGNFIPIMSPLIRRSSLGDIRFRDCITEDWFFWYDLATVARCTYVARRLATYRKQSGGRNSESKPPHPTEAPGVVEPLRLNLGCGTRGARSWHPIPGMVNLDKSLGWRFEDGLPQFKDGTVHAITVSHALMYVAEAAWPQMFAEFARVLRRGGILRITEDDTTHSRSRTYLRGWRDAVTLTGPAMMRAHMERVGFTVHDTNAEATLFPDRSLCQACHGETPNVFFVEGVRECSLLLSPHQDDETLFAAFTLIRYRPQVVVCFPSSEDYGSTDRRLDESRKAVAILGCGPVTQWDGVDIEDKMRALDALIRPTRVFAPSKDASHAEHLAVARAAGNVFGDRLTRYHTYNMPKGGKVRTGSPVAFEQSWVELKREALQCYRSQWAHPRARIFFDDDLAEYMP